LVGIGDGAVIVRLPEVGSRAVSIIGRVRLNPDRLVVIGDGAVVLPLDVKGVAAVLVEIGIVGIKADDFVVIRDGAVVFAPNAASATEEKALLYSVTAQSYSPPSHKNAATVVGRRRRFNRMALSYSVTARHPRTLINVASVAPAAARSDQTDRLVKSARAWSPESPTIEAGGLRWNRDGSRSSRRWPVACSWLSRK
jgi:hypothetical protein